LIYFDSCALVKLVLSEAESSALERFLAAHASDAYVTSELARTEVIRAVRRATDDEQVHGAARELLDRLDYVRMTRDLLEQAGCVGAPQVRSLDAIHLASGLALGTVLSSFVSYDHRLAEAAKQANLPVEIPC